MNILMAMILLAGTQAASLEEAFRIDATSAFREVSPRLWGIFFEEINHSGDGGLYAEMVRNRSFEDNRVPEGCTEDETHFISPTGWKLPKGDQAVPTPGWSLLTVNATAEFELDTEKPLNEASPTYARLTIYDSAPDGGAGISNEGYWGMALKGNAMYEVSLYVRAEPNFMGSISVSLVSAEGEVFYGGTGLKEPTESWTKQQVTLKSAGTIPRARLVLYATGTGTVCFDRVSMFPKDTYKERPNGLRPDLAEMTAALKPAFIRFPGGCIVEGFTPESAWDWKETIGDIALRPGRQNLWGYRASDGFGYHEMLQFAEDIGAEPIVVVNCGMTCQGRNPVFQPLDQLESYVQSALDAIEYANGSPDTKWGAERVKNGHPDPFNMKYITIGNENFGLEYAARYRVFADAVRRKYPHIQLICNDRMTDAPADLEEHHYYMTPAWFAANGHKYDAYDRALPKVFVSEFAANQACGKGNLEAAIGEAAFMIGLENNSDVVDMAAYAPLFNNEHNREWPVNLMVFDNRRVYGTPSYYAQKMFAENRPDVLFKSAYDTQTQERALDAGRIGLGTWRTQAEFKDIEVRSGEKELFTWDPAAGMEGWQPVAGEWSVDQGVIRQSSVEEHCTIQVGDINWDNYTLRLKARKIAGDEGFLLLFRVQDPGNWNWVNLGGWGNRQHGIECCMDGSRCGDFQRIPGNIETDRWYDIQVEVQERKACVWLDDVLILEQALQVALPGIMANAGRITATGEYVIKVSNFLDEPWETKVALDGCHGALRGTLTRLQSANRTDENTLDKPKAVAPVTEEFVADAASFTHVFPPCSLTVIRVAEQK